MARIAKPHGRSTGLADPYEVIGEEEKKLLDAKLSLLKNNECRNAFTSAMNFRALINEFFFLTHSLFPNADAMLLERNADKYLCITKDNIPLWPDDLNFSTPNSIIKIAGESRANRTAHNIPTRSCQHLCHFSRLQVRRD